VTSTSAAQTRDDRRAPAKPSTSRRTSPNNSLDNAPNEQPAEPFRTRVPEHRCPGVPDRRLCAAQQIADRVRRESDDLVSGGSANRFVTSRLGARLVPPAGRCLWRTRLRCRWLNQPLTEETGRSEREQRNATGRSRLVGVRRPRRPSCGWLSRRDAFGGCQAPTPGRLFASLRHARRFPLHARLVEGHGPCDHVECYVICAAASVSRRGEYQTERCADVAMGLLGDHSRGLMSGDCEPLVTRVPGHAANVYLSTNRRQGLGHPSVRKPLLRVEGETGGCDPLRRSLGSVYCVSACVRLVYPSWAQKSESISRQRGRRGFVKRPGPSWTTNGSQRCS
jgi:hypothetical protein